MNIEAIRQRIKMRQLQEDRDMPPSELEQDALDLCNRVEELEKSMLVWETRCEMERGPM
jgi:hypothetical protein